MKALTGQPFWLPGLDFRAVLVRQPLVFEKVNDMFGVDIINNK